MRSIKWTYHKDWSFPSTLFFCRFCFSLRISYKELIWCTNYPNVHIHIFCKRWSFISGCFFPVSILKIIWDVLRCFNFSVMVYQQGYDDWYPWQRLISIWSKRVVTESRTIKFPDRLYHMIRQDVNEDLGVCMLNLWVAYVLNLPEVTTLL